MKKDINDGLWLQYYFEKQFKKRIFDGNNHHNNIKTSFMSEEPIKYMKIMSDDAIVNMIGSFVRHHRLAQNITQQELATRAGINRTTLSDMETGRRFHIVTLIQVLRILNALHVFDSFKIEEQISPMLLAEMELKKRKKASANKGTPSTPKSDW